MSRCFPFPPPGYDTPDDANLLAKEEKKHKKEKEKRERKEKKDKKKSEEKHKEKKDRKEKHKDKKSKDRDKDKEKTKTSEEKTTLVISECQNGRKLDPIPVQGNGNTDQKILLELGKRIKDNNGATQSEIFQKIRITDQRSEGKKVENNECLAKGNESRDVENNQNRIEPVIKLLGKEEEKRVEGEEKKKRKKSERGDKPKDKDRDKKSKSKDKKQGKEKVEEKAKEKEQQQQPKEKMLIHGESSSTNAIHVHKIKPSYPLKETNYMNSGSEGNLGKRKWLEMNGTLHENGTQRTKVLKPVSSPHQVVSNGKKVEPCQNATQFSSVWKEKVDNYKLDNKVSSGMENGKKLQPPFKPKETITDNHKVVNNGLPSAQPVSDNGRKLEENQTFSAHKVNNRVSTSHLVLENGKKAELCNTENQLPASRRQFVVGYGNLDGTNSRMNGLEEAQKPEAILCKPPSSAPVRIKKDVIKSSSKPPHPDLKYLSQILSVPKIEWSEFDDQEWLFSDENHQTKKPESSSCQDEGSTKQVWEEAIRIESANCIALPYVIPY